MSQKYTEARKRGNKKWDAANLDRISREKGRPKRNRWRRAAYNNNERTCEL